MEAAVLVWAIDCRIRGRTGVALALATMAIFTKAAWLPILVAGLAGLVILDAAASVERLLAVLAVVPVTFAAAALLCGLTLGWTALGWTLNPSSGAALYRAYDLGFFREGRSFWARPRGIPSGGTSARSPALWLVGSLVPAASRVRRRRECSRRPGGRPQ